MKSLWFKKAVRLVSGLTIVALLSTAVACGAQKQAEPAATEPAKTEAAKETDKKADGKPVTIKIITWAQQSNIDPLNALNAKFSEKNPNVKFVIDSVNANDYPTLQQTRISAGDVDIVTGFAFDQVPQDYMKGVDKRAWQQFVESGAYLDITDQPFLKNWDPAMIKDAASYKGKVYGINVGKVGFNGVFYNKKIFADNGLSEPKTWEELMNICKTLKAKNITPFTGAAKDSWPINMMAHAFIAANEPDMPAYSKGLWTGERKFTDEGSMKIWNRVEEWSTYFEKGVAGIDYSSVVGRFVAKKAAMMPDGTWDSGTIDAAKPDFEYGYFCIPGDTAGAEPIQLAGKYDLQFQIYSKTANKDICLKWMEFLSQKENYTPFISALSMFPTMPDVQVSNKFINSIADKNKNFRLAFERITLEPKGVGQYAAGVFPLTQLKAFGGTIATAKELAELQQKDWDAAVKAAK
ncbi:MAG: extracellular solute-binding protein [Clostridia bacterium]|nr:extracellular solute-binding protein [Clostridia bacterium]